MGEVELAGGDARPARLAAARAAGSGGGALGGGAARVGAGALLVNYAKTYFTGALPEVWLYALGALFILVTLLLPRGLVGLRPATWFPSRRRLGVRPA